MPGAAAIKAGEAFWEVTVKDKSAPGLQAAQARMTLFSKAVAAIGTTAATVGSVVAAGIAAIATGTVAIITKSLSTFLSISEQMRRFSGLANPKAEGLTDAWGEFKAVISAVFFIIGDAVAGPLTQMLKVLTAITLQMAQFATHILNGGILNAFVTLSTAVQAVWSAMLVGMELALLNTIHAVIGVIQGAVNALVAPLKELEHALPVGIFGRIGGAALRGLSGAGSAFAGAGAGLTSGLQADIAARSAKLTALIAELGSAIGMGQQDQGGPFGGIPHLTSSAGTFSSRGAGLMGIGPGGGLKTSDDETHKALERVIRIIGELGGPVFK